MIGLSCFVHLGGLKFCDRERIVVLNFTTGRPVEYTKHSIDGVDWLANADSNDQGLVFGS